MHVFSLLTKQNTLSSTETSYSMMLILADVTTSKKSVEQAYRHGYISSAKRNRTIRHLPEHRSLNYNAQVDASEAISRGLIS